MSAHEITMNLVIAMIENNCLRYDGFPEAKNPVDLVCAAYTQILETVKPSSQA